MRIQHNIMAMNAYRNYNNNTSALSKNLEKLSSGYKINRAGDDAAGLAISEKMRAQITGLSKAQDNAKDGISLVQTAEGALTEVHDMLNRMYSLAEQSANGTYENETDRAQLQKEVVQLKSEIDRIADSSNFNGIKLLDGSMEGEITTEGSTPVSNLFAGMPTTATTTDGFTIANAATNGVAILNQKEVAEQKASFAIDLSKTQFTAGTQAATITLTVGGTAITIQGAANTDMTGTEIAGEFDGKTIAIGGITYDIAAEGSKLTFTMQSTPSEIGITSQTSSSLSVTFDASIASDANGKLDGFSSQAVTELQPGRVNQVAHGAGLILEIDDAQILDGRQITIDGETYTFAIGADSKFKGSGSNIIDLTDFTEANGYLNANGTLADAGMREALARFGNAAASSGGFDVSVAANNNKYYLQITQKSSDGRVFTDVKDLTALVSASQASADAAAAASGLTLQIGDTSDSFNQLTVSISDCHTEAIGIADLDIGTQKGAADALDVIKSAINYISDVRGTLGATQNRLDHTINNLSVMEENIQDAESTIRDTDIADEMMSYTKNNILIQSAQAMLAQANQVPQGVLQLLQ